MVPGFKLFFVAAELHIFRANGRGRGGKRQCAEDRALRRALLLARCKRASRPGLRIRPPRTRRRRATAARMPHLCVGTRPLDGTEKPNERCLRNARRASQSWSIPSVSGASTGRYRRAPTGVPKNYNLGTLASGPAAFRSEPHPPEEALRTWPRWLRDAAFRVNWQEHPPPLHATADPQERARARTSVRWGCLGTAATRMLHGARECSRLVRRRTHIQAFRGN